MSYKLVDIDEMDIEYTFTASELSGVTFMDMINLQDRGGYSSTYHLPLSGLPVGQMLTIRNQNFGFSSTKKYTGVKMVLGPDTSVWGSIYTFCFIDQVTTFMFDGTQWVLNRPRILPIPFMSFLESDTMERGYVDVADFSDPLKAVMFSNLDLTGFDPQTLENRYFRDGKVGTLEAAGIKKHTHTALPHAHNYLYVSNMGEKTKRADTTGSGGDMKAVLDPAQNSNKTSTETTVTILPTGVEEMNLLHITGRYVFKCY